MRPVHPWTLDPEVRYLNHGAFGACPAPVLARQHELRARLEREPVQFLQRDLEGLLDQARIALGVFLGADPDSLAFVPNATAGVNTILRSLNFRPGDEILLTDHEYNASANAARFVARRSGASVVTARVPFPIDGPGAVVRAVMEAVTSRTRLCLIDDVTSPTALVFPIAEVVAALRVRGIDTLVDGAHAPGTVPLALDELGAAYYTGNLHKWVCAPKGAGFVHVRPDRQEPIRPLSISHGANSIRRDRGRFRLEADWSGTSDPTPFLSVPAAIDFLGGLLPGGWPTLMADNHRLALEGRDVLAAALGVARPAPDAMLGSMAALPLPPDRFPPTGLHPLEADPLVAELYRRGVEVPVFSWPFEPGRGPGHRLVRISAQQYNDPGDYEALARLLESDLMA